MNTYSQFVRDTKRFLSDVECWLAGMRCDMQAYIREYHKNCDFNKMEALELIIESQIYSETPSFTFLKSVTSTFNEFKSQIIEIKIKLKKWDNSDPIKYNYYREFGIATNSLTNLINWFNRQDLPTGIPRSKTIIEFTPETIQNEHPFTGKKAYEVFNYLKDRVKPDNKAKYTYIYNFLLEERIESNLPQKAYFEFVSKTTGMKMSKRKQPSANKGYKIDIIRNLYSEYLKEKGK